MKKMKADPTWLPHLVESDVWEFARDVGHGKILKSSVTPIYFMDSIR
jgi:hypothetical protein